MEIDIVAQNEREAVVVEVWTELCPEAPQVRTVWIFDSERRAPRLVTAHPLRTIRAMKELEDGKGKRFESAEELFRDLDI